MALVALLAPGAINGGTSKTIPKGKCGAKHHLQTLRQDTLYMQSIMREPQYPIAYYERRTTSCAFHSWLRKTWRERHRVVHYQYTHPARLSAWLCIHSGEGAWNDPNAPYYGGLQMDYGFQQTYGRELLARKGTADHWTMWEQIWVAERAYKSGRGFYPWPNTARACGLI